MENLFGIINEPNTPVTPLLPREGCNEDTIYVAVGKDVKESKPNLVWALDNARGRKICILHIHIPPKKMSFRAAFSLIDSHKQYRIREYHRIEKEKVYAVLEVYTRICEQSGVEVEKLYAESDSIENGIVELISRHSIRMLVIGAASNRLRTRKLTEIKSRKANYVCVHAPAFCYIGFVFKGFLIYTRFNTETLSNIGQSSSSEPEYITERSGNDDENPSLEAVAYRFLNKEGSFSAWNSVLSRASSDESFFSTCSTSEREDDSASLTFSFIQMTQMDNISPTTIKVGSQNHEIYDNLDQYISEIDNFKQEAYEESIRCNKAKKETIEALHKANTFKTMHEKELIQKIEFEEALARVTEEVEKLEWKLKEATEQMQGTKQQNSFLGKSIANSNTKMQELEQRVVSQEGLLEEYSKHRTEMLVERDNALKISDELRKHKIEERSQSFVTEISSAEIQEATRNFDPALIILEKDYVITYRGFIRNTQVSIKVLQPYTWQASSKIQQEVNILSMLRHPNLIMLIGACPEEWTLVYEYCPNGNLEDRLSCKDNTPPLPWQTRICVATELCYVLMYLHSCTPNPIVYGNLEPSNILLDTNYVAKLGDLGMCRTRIPAKDSFAYMDPEFFSTGELLPESNVYSFGIILLRLLTGRPASGLIHKVQIALDEGEFNELLDSTAGDWPYVKADQLAHIAMRCCEMKPWHRPDLSSEVWKVLESMIGSCGISPFQLVSEENHQMPESFKENHKMPESFLCPIYQEVMQDPVLANDGFSYEAEAIKQWFNGGHVTSPMTNLKLAHCNLLPNHALRSAIQAWLQHP